MVVAWMIGWTAACLTVAPDFAWAREAGRWSGLGDAVFHSLGVADGLPNPVAQAIAEDHDGFLWIGTGDGLVRWDGYRLRVWRPQGHAAGALPDGYIQALHTDRQGRLWIGMATRGLARYDPDRDVFRGYGLDGDRRGRLEVRAIADDGDAGLWVGGADGLYHLDFHDGLTHALVRDQSHGASLPAGRVLTLLHDRAGALWVGTGRGLFRQDPGGQAFREVVLARPQGPPAAVTALMQDGAGRVWVGTATLGAFVVGADRRVIRQVEESEAVALPVQTQDVETIAEASPGEVWLGTTGAGIVAVAADSLQARPIRHDPARPTSLADDTVWSIHRDRSGLMWVASNGGLSRSVSRGGGILTLFGVPGRQDGVSDTDVTSVMAAPDGGIWLGLMHDGVNIIDPDARHIARLKHNPSFPSAIVDGFAASPGAGTFIATWRDLYHVDATGAGLAPVAFPALSDRHAVAALASIGRTMWIGLRDGVYRQQLDAGFGPQRVIGTERLTDKRVRTMLPDRSGKLWIGTWDGLNLFDPASGHIRQVLADPSNPTALPAGPVMCLLLDAHGRLWVGTNGGGIAILTGDMHGILQFRRLGLEDGLPDANIDKLLTAPDGQIWASTDDGLARIDPDSLAVRTFHLSDGVAIPAYWADSGAVAASGDLLFGGAGGLTVVRPRELTATPYRPRLVVTDIRVGGQAVPEGRFNHGSAKPSPLVIRASANSLAVEFAALDYADASRNLYAYQLGGVDAEWIATDASRRLAAYTNLPPGHFILRLRGSDAAGVWSETELRVPIWVLPAWYQTRWFQSAVILLAALFLAALYRVPTILLRRRQRELEHLIDQRTAELSRSNQALHQAADILRDLSKVGQQITASLDIDTVFAILHDNISTLLHASDLAIYLKQRPGQSLVPRFSTDGRECLAPDRSAFCRCQPVIRRAADERREVVVRGPEPSILVCSPLIVLDRVIGVIAIHVRVYDEREKLIFHTLSAYGAVALGNAETTEAFVEVQSQLEQLAFSDGLTKLPNRRAYVDQFSRFARQARERSRIVALLLIDLDRFKEINDTFGHDAGDAMLVEAAARLRASVRSCDIVMRLGGDEFAILLGDLDDATAVEEACLRISESFARDMDFNSATFQVSTSIGVALFPEDGEAQEGLYKAADIALYEAKRAGRNTWRRFHGADRHVM